MKIEYLYAQDVLSCRPTETLAAVADTLTRSAVGALPVVHDDGRLVGIISERDLVRALAEHLDAGAVRVDAYLSSGVQVADPQDESWTVGERMLDAGIRHLPVVEGGRLVGILSMRDLLAVETWA